MFDQTLFIVLLIPVVALLGIIFGAPARMTALLAAVGNLGISLVTAITWTRFPGVGSFEHIVLEKPQLTLALGLPDGMSVVLMLLTTLVTVAAVASGKCPEGRERFWYPSVLLISLGALGAFLSTDLFFFYAFHELALIPTFLMIGMLGKGDRKAAAWKITLYLAFGSIILLAGLLWLANASGANSLLFADILAADIDKQDQIGIAAFLIVGFGILVSLFPFHSWAAPAYASAPAPVAMLHAGVLKKFGLFGLLKLYPAISEGLQFWLVPLLVLLLGNIVWVGFVTLNQKRLDSLLANSSVMHMGYIFLAFAALIAAGSMEANTIAFPAAVILMFGHGVSIALLFALSDKIERRTGTLFMEEMGGLAKNAPGLAFLFGLGGMASIGLPGLANFVGEAGVFLSGFKNWNPTEGLGPVQITTIIAISGVVISAVYMLRAIKHIFHGPEVTSTDSAEDLSLMEKLPSGLLAFALLLVGLFPNLLLKLVENPSEEPVQVIAHHHEGHETDNSHKNLDS